jgi:hypothetical protein
MVWKRAQGEVEGGRARHAHEPQLANQVIGRMWADRLREGSRVRTLFRGPSTQGCSMEERRNASRRSRGAQRAW